MSASDWLDAARLELDELNAEAVLSPADAWRALALAARLDASGSLHVGADRVAQLHASTEPGDPATALTDLAAILDEAPREPDEILLILLDVDDRAGIEILLGNMEVANELATRAAGVVSLHPEQVLGLGGFAAMRLECLDASHPVQALWQAVVEAPAQAVVAHLPSRLPSHVDAGLVGRLLDSRPSRTWTPIVLEGGRAVRPLGDLDRRLLRPAAATAESDPYPVHDGAGRVIGWVYPSPETGRPTLELRLSSSAPPGQRFSLLLTDAAGAVLATRVLDVETDGREVYADLSGAGPGSSGLIAELLAESGLDRDDAHLRVGVDD